jgi:GLPGLI family protein
MKFSTMVSIKRAAFLTAGIVFFTTPLFAQKTYNEVTLSYKISVTSTGERSELAKSLEGATLTVMVKGNQTRSDMVSPIGSESSLFDTRTGKGFILKEYSGQKLLITLNRENWKQKNQYYHNLDFKIDPEKESLRGYAVKKASAVLPNGKNFVVYFTPDMIITNNQYNNSFDQLPGVPVQFELESGNLVFRYELINVSTEPISASKFEIPKTGYRMMTYEDNQQLKKGDKR